MANPEVERLVDDLIKQGRVQDSMRNEYVSLIERGLGDHLLRGADYTNKSKVLAEERRNAEAWVLQEKQKLQQERQKLDGWYNNIQGELNEYERVKKEVLPTLATYEQALKDYRLEDGRAIIEAVSPASRTAPSNPSYKPPVNPMNPSNPNTPDKYLTRDDANKFGGNLLNLMKRVNKVQSEHREIFGTELKDDLFDHFEQTGEDPYEHWRVKYAVDNRRAELAKKDEEARYAKMEQEIREKVMRELTTDPSRVVGAPFNPNVGGASPVMERYAASRALTHSQPHATDSAAIGKEGEYIPPEKRPDIAYGRERVNGAVDMFRQNWDVTGTPISEKGKELSRKYVFND